MHFWVSAVRGGFQTAFCCPRNMGTNWFIPALVNSRFGESGSNDDEGTIVCSFSRKKSRNDCLISEPVMLVGCDCGSFCALSDSTIAHWNIACRSHLAQGTLSRD